MEQLSIYLPPFAGDYSGVCSALYDLDCVIIIDDASCCTRNYVGYDEPRWTIQKKPAFSSRLRTMDAVLGDDEKLIRQTIEAAQKYHPEFIAVLGTPVPAVIGKDMNGIAREIEERSGYPALGFDTTGFSYYNKGVSSAFVRLLKRFAAPAKTIANGVNILGLTPLDFSANDNGKILSNYLEENGFKVICSFLMNADLGHVRRSAAASLNLVVSQSGWLAAEYMKERFGIPYVAANPVGKLHARAVISAVRQTMDDKVCRIINGTPAEVGSSPGVLIVGDQIMANSLRAAMRLNGCGKNIAVASFFAIEPELAEPGDAFIRNEEELIVILRSGRFDMMVADPLISGIPDTAALKYWSIPHPAVSGPLYWDDVPVFLGDAFEDTTRLWCE
jgi:nitrogenase molybdenum-cofactor synthesis protein NifE